MRMLELNCGWNFQILSKKYEYRTGAIIACGLYTFYPLFEDHLCTVTFGLMYGEYSRAVSNIRAGYSGVLSMVIHAF